MIFENTLRMLARRQRLLLSLLLAFSVVNWKAARAQLTSYITPSTVVNANNGMFDKLQNTNQIKDQKLTTYYVNYAAELSEEDWISFEHESPTGSLMTIYMAQDDSQVAQVEVFMGDQVINTPENRCHSGHREGFITCERTGKFLYFFNKSASDFRFSEIFAWDLPLVMTSLDEESLRTSGLRKVSDEKYNLSRLFGSTDGSVKCIDFEFESSGAYLEFDLPTFSQVSYIFLAGIGNSMNFDSVEVKLFDQEGAEHSCEAAMDFTQGQQFNSVACLDQWAARLRFSFYRAGQTYRITDLCKIGVFGVKQERCTDVPTSHSEEPWPHKDDQITFDLHNDSEIEIALPNFQVEPASASCFSSQWNLIRKQDGQDVALSEFSSYFSINLDESKLILKCDSCRENLALRKDVHVALGSFEEYFLQGSIEYGDLLFQTSNAASDYRIQIRFYDRCFDAQIVDQIIFFPQVPWLNSQSETEEVFLEVPPFIDSVDQDILEQNLGSAVGLCGEKIVAQQLTSQTLTSVSDIFNVNQNTTVDFQPWILELDRSQVTICDTGTHQVAYEVTIRDYQDIVPPLTGSFDLSLSCPEELTSFSIENYFLADGSSGRPIDKPDWLATGIFAFDFAKPSPFVYELPIVSVYPSCPTAPGHCFQLEEFVVLKRSATGESPDCSSAEPFLDSNQQRVLSVSAGNALSLSTGQRSLAGSHELCLLAVFRSAESNQLLPSLQLGEFQLKLEDSCKSAELEWAGQIGPIKIVAGNTNPYKFAFPSFTNSISEETGNTAACKDYSYTVSSPQWLRQFIEIEYVQGAQQFSLVIDASRMAKEERELRVQISVQLVEYAAIEAQTEFDLVIEVGQEQTQEESQGTQIDEAGQAEGQELPEQSEEDTEEEESIWQPVWEPETPVQDESEDTKVQNEETEDKSDQVGAESDKQVEDGEDEALADGQAGDKQSETVETGYIPKWPVAELLKDKLQDLQLLVVEDLFEQEDPHPKINKISQIGEVEIRFNQEMYIRAILDEFKFEPFQSYADPERTLSVEETKAVGLSSILTAQIVQQTLEEAAENNDESLHPAFELSLVEYDDLSLFLQIEFEEPLRISIDSLDTLIITFVEPEVFISKRTGKAVTDKNISKQVPKQFVSAKQLQLMETAADSVTYASQTVFGFQFIATIVLAASLKAMWNLMHFMQLVAYLRMLVSWPANVQMMLSAVKEAITLDETLPGPDQFIPGIDDAPESNQAQQLVDKELPESAEELDVGIFMFCLIGLVITLVLYFVLRVLALRLPFLNKVVLYLHDKLFYNAWIRYMIESNLVETHNCIFYLHITGTLSSEKTFVANAITMFRIFLLLLIVIWIVFAFVFLYCQRAKLSLKNFQRKFVSMYSGIKRNSALALTYTSIFCARRFLLVLAFLIFDQTGIWLIHSFNLVQTWYFWYITTTTPHEEKIHNRLEVGNELFIIQIQSLMLFIAVDARNFGSPELQWNAGFAIMALVALNFLGNMFALLYINVVKVKTWCRLRRLRKVAILQAQSKKRERLQRLASLKIDEADEEISLENDPVCQSLSLEDEHNEGDNMRAAQQEENQDELLSQTDRIELVRVSYEPVFQTPNIRLRTKNETVDESTLDKQNTKALCDQSLKQREELTFQADLDVQVAEEIESELLKKQFRSVCGAQNRHSLLDFEEEKKQNHNLSFEQVEVSAQLSEAIDKMSSTQNDQHKFDGPLEVELQEVNLYKTQNNFGGNFDCRRKTDFGRGQKLQQVGSWMVSKQEKQTTSSPQVLPSTKIPKRTTTLYKPNQQQSLDKAQGTKNSFFKCAKKSPTMKGKK